MEDVEVQDRKCMETVYYFNIFIAITYLRKYVYIPTLKEFMMMEVYTNSLL